MIVDLRWLTDRGLKVAEVRCDGRRAFLPPEVREIDTEAKEVRGYAADAAGRVRLFAPKFELRQWSIPFERCVVEMVGGARVEF